VAFLPLNAFHAKIRSEIEALNAQNIRDSHTELQRAEEERRSQPQGDFQLEVYIHTPEDIAEVEAVREQCTQDNQIRASD